MYTCAHCTVHACWEAEPQKLPVNCPMRQQEQVRETMAVYEEPENQDFYVKASEIEARGYGEWVRLREIIELCKSMGYRKVGLAFCKGLRKEAKVAADILREHGLEVVSVICKAGGIDKTEAGIGEQMKLHPGEFDPMCNPILQAKLLNEQKTEFNIALGLCVGHDSLLYKYSDALMTTLVAKDRVLAHNPVGALYQADGYCKRRF